MTAQASAVTFDPRTPGQGAAKRPFVQQLFSSIAGRYDWFNRVSSCGLDQGWRRQALRRGDVRPAHRVLDVCAGTGDLAILRARQQGGETVGVDFNREMLARAKAKQERAGLRISWLQGDAEALPFPDASFDRIVVGFSTRNLSNLTNGLRDMVRVLKPGGRLIILETGYPSNPVIRFGYQAFLYTVVRAVGFVLTGQVWPFTYLARSVQAFITPGEMVDRLQRLETQVQYVPLSGGLASLYLAAKPASSSCPQPS